MILSDIQTYLSQQGKASLAELSVHFRIDADALRPMLAKLVRKHRLRKIEQPQKCCGCSACTAESLIVYEWVGAKRKSFATASKNGQ
ncbi:FeoC-like transcriptional regulator [Phormidium sp. CCY1219]|uniref:FeoC-like transcriptional regulator n=1 Tax=Phormidium sp. CCY1219 TaxID=2886104 RepID=UPI002D1F7EA7|nr:FeoC-like transcriptional regulator [Phormidium sp. CCY1219]MEB3829193.1 FeoC-like transcriptional regulator [Phormidium sp. CCY1219]